MSAGHFMDTDFDALLQTAVKQGASDIHLRTGHPPVFRQDGLMRIVGSTPLPEKDILDFVKQILPRNALQSITSKTDFDFSFQLDNLARFRVNMFYEMNQLGVVMRIIPLKIASVEDLGLPPVLKRFTDMHKGLVLVTGPTGSGKSTTLAALLNLINETQAKHIITLEDPVEYVYNSAKSVVTQRQLGADTDTFPNGIKYALRQDPDVILIGEMRDRETISSALHAAETGHLVFSTLHTIDAVQTVNRIINIFEPHERDPVRRQLAEVLQGTVSQRLVRKATGHGRLAVSEIMVVTPAIRDYIIRDEMSEVYEMMKTIDFEGMCSLNQSLHQACLNQLITPEEALTHSDNPNELQQLLRGAFHGTGQGAALQR